MKIINFGKKNPNSICLSDGKSDTWYYVAAQIVPQLRELKKGEDVEIECFDGNRGKVITLFKTKEGVIGSKETAHSAGSAYTPKEKTTYSYGKSAEEQNSIKRQAIMHAVSRTIIGLQGSVDINNVCSVASTLYEHYTKLVG
jgi:hypothetical protein